MAVTAQVMEVLEAHGYDPAKNTAVCACGKAINPAMTQCNACRMVAWKASHGV